MVFTGKQAVLFFKLPSAVIQVYHCESHWSVTLLVSSDTGRYTSKNPLLNDLF
jgi:hypothetical protein